MALWVEAGDTFFTRSKTILGRLIRWGEVDKGELKGSTWTNHTGVIVESGWIGSTVAGEPVQPQAIVIEALWKTRKGPLKVNGTQVRVFRPIPAYDDVELARFRHEAEGYVGDTYGWWKLFVQLGDKTFFGGKKVLGQMLFKKSRPICSFLAGFTNQMAQSGTRITARLTKIENGLVGSTAGFAVNAFGIPPQACDPDSMMDYCLAHKDEWIEVE
jgi:hypothetical protein